MTQILLGQSYYLRFDPKLWKAMQPYPPLGTLYAASWLRLHGYEVALFDAMLAESEREWGSALDEHKPQYAVIYEDNFNYLSKMCLLRMREAAFEMIQMAKARGCTVILCGADVTDHYDKYLERGADYCIVGEGEETLLELLNQLSAGKEADNILGVASRNTQHALRRPDITDLDKLPFPAWDLVDVERYRNIWIARHGYFSMNMVTTRGCPYHCNWCAKPIWGQRYNSRSPENVTAEMKWIKETFAPDHIWFADDILGLKPHWLERFAALLREADALIPFKCLQRADLVNEKTASALAQAGCKTVWIGAESGSQKILDAMEKGDKVEDIYNAARLLQAHGIEVGFFLQFGYPGETWEDVQKTLKMVRECAPDDIGISISYPLPGTKFYERVKLELGEKQNWVDSEDLAMLYRGPFPTEFYRVLHGRAHYEFRARKALKQPSWRGLVSLPRNLFGLIRSGMQLRKFVLYPGARSDAALPVIARSAAAAQPPLPDLNAVDLGFSRKAEVYDAYCESHPVVRWAREIVRKQVMDCLPPGASILELNAGTGADAAYFVGQGYRVHATDIAGGMISAIQNKIRSLEAGDRLTAQQISFTELDRVEGAPYDLVFSNFGGLNCIPDLRAVTKHLRTILKPGGYAVWVVMPPVCPWELVQMVRGRFRLAARRLDPNGVLANVEGARVRTWYFTPRQARQAFPTDFQLICQRSLSLFCPPSFMDRFPHRFPRLTRRLMQLDERLGVRSPFNAWGDFVLYAFRHGR